MPYVSHKGEPLKLMTTGWADTTTTGQWNYFSI
jgi:hypothetical protein